MGPGYLGQRSWGVDTHQCIANVGMRVSCGSREGVLCLTSMVASVIDDTDYFLLLESQEDS